MFNLNINFYKVIKENTPSDLRTPGRINFMAALKRPFLMMWQEFLLKVQEIKYKCLFNGTIIYLETALNDRFDNVNRDIYIENAAHPKVYIYLKSELKPPLIMYRKWNAATSFAVGKFCWYQGQVWVANALALNKVPGVDPEWTLTPRLAPILRRKINYNGGIGFYVYVPAALVYDVNEMKKLINYYKLAGRGYEIRTY